MSWASIDPMWKSASPWRLRICALAPRRAASGQGESFGVRGLMLGLRPLPRTFAACLRDVASAKMEVRAEATEELGRHLAHDHEASDLPKEDRERAVQALIKVLSDAHPAVRSRAATALADAHATTALPALLLAVEDDDSFVRQMALSALGELKDGRATSKLSRTLSDPRPEVRYQALIAFTRVCPAEGEAAITKAMKDDDSAVRHIALRLAEDATEPREKPSSLDVWAREATRLLADEHRDVAVAAAIFLVRAVPPSDLPKAARQMLVAVANGEWRGEVGVEEEQGAIEACGEGKLKEAIPGLERRAYGLARFVRETSVLHAKSALAALGHARATAELLQDLASANPEARDKAIVAVGRARLEAARETLTNLVSVAKGEPTRALAEEALARLPQK